MHPPNRLAASIRRVVAAATPSGPVRRLRGTPANGQAPAAGNRRPSLFRKATAAAVAIGLVGGGLVLNATTAAAAAQVTGTVFLDYAGDGAFDNGGAVRDALLSGVTVTAFDAAGAQVGQAFSQPALTGGGNYTLDLDAGVAAGDPLRIEFTGLPTGSYDTFDAGASGVQFTTAGAAAVNYGAFDPRQYNPVTTSPTQQNPALFAAIMVAGAREGTRSSNEPVVVGNRWTEAGNVSGGTASFATRVTLATYTRVGSVHALASDYETGNVYAAASYKRLSDLGPAGLGGIYLIQDALAANGGAKTPSGIVDIDVTSLGIVVGSAKTTAERELGDPNLLIRDVDGFQQAGKIGIGGMAIDPEARILYFTNLLDKRIYALDITVPAAPTLIGSVASPAGDGQRAYALTIHQGQLYVGYNDTGEDEAWRSADDANMNFYVSRTPALTAENHAFGSWTTVLTGDLGYLKGNPAAGWGGTATNNYATANPQITRWNSWTDKWSETVGGTTRSVAIASSGGTWGANTHIYPQPLVGGLAFDREGYLTVGFVDRTEWQSGNRNCAADTVACVTNGQNNAGPMFETLAAGDTLLAAPSYNAQGQVTGFALESNGQAGSRTATGKGVSPRIGASPAGGEGPGGHEFYDDRQQGTTANHRENTLGAVVVAPGASQVASTAYDPLSPIRVTGVQWFDLADGDYARGYQHTQDPGDPTTALNSAARTSFQKGGGMGGLTLLTKAAPVEIGNRVWFDLDNDGIQDADEPVIADAIVELWAVDADGNPVGDDPIATKTTGPDGSYFFRTEDAPSGGSTGFTKDGDYVVIFKPASANGPVALRDADGSAYSGALSLTWDQLELTTQNASSAVPDAAQDPQRDSNPDPATGRAPVTVGSAGQNDHSIDAGWRLPVKVSIGDFLWIDADGDGVQDDGEAPVPAGTVVKLFKGETEVGSALTDADGYYFFADLDPSTAYTVVFPTTVTVAGVTYELTLAGQGDDPAADSNPGADGKAPVTTPATGENKTAAGEADDPTIDAGYKPVPAVPAVSVGDFVWEDANDNGLQDDGDDSGIEGVELTISRSDDQPVKNLDGTDRADLTEETDSDGHYSFDGLPVLPQGVYYVVTVTKPPAGMDPAQANVGADESIDSSTGSETARALDGTEGNDRDDTLDFGFVKAPVLSYALGDVVWVDRNQNGQQDSVGQDGGEKPLAGVTVKLLDAAGDPAKHVDGTPVAPVTTDPDGRYLFDNLPAGTYIVEFVLPDGYRFTSQNADGVPGGANSDADEATGRTGTITLGNDSVTTEYDREFGATEGIDPTWDAGVVPQSVSVGDFVWHDLDGDGIQSDGEPGIQNVTLTLTGPNGQPVTNVYGEPVGPVQTDPDGKYEFKDLPVLPQGSYTVTISGVPEQFKPTAPGAGDDPAKDSSTGSATSGPLTKDGDKDLTLDFGFVLKTPGATIDKSDENGNKGDDASDPVDLSPTGKVGIVLTLTNNGDEPITKIGLNDASTGSGSISYPLQCVAPGGVEFTLDTPESFWMVDGEEEPVEETEPTEPAEENGEGEATEPDTDDAAEPDSGDAPEPEGDAEEPVLDEDAPVVVEPLAVVKEYGVLGLGEQIVCTTTLTGVTAGDPHQNVVTLWAEGTISHKPVVDPKNPGTPEKPNRPTDPYNAVVKTYAIGDYVWIDADGDGIQDESEQPLKGVKVTLLDDEGNPVPGKTTETDDEGYYQFDELDPGTYQVRFELPRGYVLTVPDQGSDDAVDSDALPTDATKTVGETQQITLDSTNPALVRKPGVKATEGIDPTWDAGVRLAEVTVGDKVWKDISRDGIQDPGEPGIPGVVLVIERTDGKPVTDVDGNPVGSETTDGNGEYSFERLPLLPEGVDYVVKIDREASKPALGNLIPTEPGQGDDPAKDSSTWEAASSGLKKDGDKDLTLDFGFIVPKVSVGDRVWEDSNKNGVQDAGEPGIDGVVLKITGPEGWDGKDVFGNPVMPVTTADGGKYLFENLPALAEGQSYTVTIDAEASAAALAGFQPTKTGQGTRETDSATGSDSTLGLTADGDADLTLDFGFIRPSVTVGDKVWKDSNRNGRQDSGEPGIKGVVLVITGPDGGEVTDVYGNVVGPVTTDGSGKYLFKDLPILPEGQSYTVSIDEEASKSALKGLKPTTSNVGDRAGDSSEWSESTEGLTADGDEDLTLDFGFITPPKPGELPNTGANALLPLGIGGLLVAIGAGLLAWRRRREGLVD